MKRTAQLHTFFICTCLVFIFCSTQVQAECSQDDIFEMLDEGYTKREIERICQKLSQQRPQRQRRPQFTSLCSTDAGTCQMVTPGPVGEACFCMTMFGPIYGVTIPQ